MPDMHIKQIHGFGIGKRGGDGAKSAAGGIAGEYHILDPVALLQESSEHGHDLIGDILPLGLRHTRFRKAVDTQPIAWYKNIQC
jgi:hypothetical protein